jgi:hypothetical protein
VQQYLKEENILLIMTLSHAGIVERAIRTIKDMLYKRLEHDPNRPWYGELLQQVIFVYNYGREHSRIHMTLNQATKPQNEDKVRRNLNKHAVYNRKYPNIQVGDTVEFIKRSEYLISNKISVWTKSKYTVEDIIKKNDQNFYRTTWNNGRLLLRNEILKIPN